MQKRRYHKKSRKGCLGCKERRIKCDESGPPCSNCVVRNHGCVYSYPRPVAGVHDSPPAGSDAAAAAATTSPAPSSSPSSTANTTTTAATELSSSGLTPERRVLELELMHHYSTQTWKSLSSMPCDEHMYREVLPKLALSRHPFLLNGLLAVTALDLARIKRQEAEAAAAGGDTYPSNATNVSLGRTQMEYVRAAREYYSQGSESFRAELSSGVNKENAGALFMFAYGAAIINIAMPPPPNSKTARRNRREELRRRDPQYQQDFHQTQSRTDYLHGGPGADDMIDTAESQGSYALQGSSALSLDNGAGTSKGLTSQQATPPEDQNQQCYYNFDGTATTGTEEPNEEAQKHEDIDEDDDEEDEFSVLNRIYVMFNLLHGLGIVTYSGWDLIRHSEVWPQDGTVTMPTKEQADALLDADTKQAFERLWTLRNYALEVDESDAHMIAALIEDADELYLGEGREFEEAVSAKLKAASAQPNKVKRTRWWHYRIALLCLERFFAEDVRGTTRGMSLGWPPCGGPYLAEDVQSREPYSLLLLMHWAVLIWRLEGGYWWVDGLGRGVICEVTKILVEARAQDRWAGAQEDPVIEECWVLSINWARGQVGLPPIL